MISLNIFSGVCNYEMTDGSGRGFVDMRLVLADDEEKALVLYEKLLAKDGRKAVSKPMMTRVQIQTEDDLKISERGGTE